MVKSYYFIYIFQFHFICIACCFDDERNTCSNWEQKRGETKIRTEKQVTHERKSCFVLGKEADNSLHTFLNYFYFAHLCLDCSKCKKEAFVFH